MSAGSQPFSPQRRLRGTAGGGGCEGRCQLGSTTPGHSRRHPALTGDGVSTEPLLKRRCAWDIEAIIDRGGFMATGRAKVIDDAIMGFTQSRRSSVKGQNDAAS